MQLKNDKIQLTIDDQGRVTELSAPDGGVQAPIDTASVTEPWAIALRDQDGHCRIVRPQSTPSVERDDTSGNQALVVTWSERGTWGEMTVKARIELPQASELSAWTLEIDNRTSSALWEVSYPRLSGLQPFADDGSKDYVAAPKGMGQICNNPVALANRDHGDLTQEERDEYGTLGMQGNRNAIAFSYPGMWAMQVFPFGRWAHGGVYFAAHDGQALYKRFGMYGDGEDGKHAALVMKQYPEDRTAAGGQFASFYPTMIGLYQGEWWDACELYREWALQQMWCRPGPVKDRDDIPAWSKNLDLWYWNWQFANSFGNHPLNLIPIIKYIKEKFDCELAFHWYGCNGENTITGPWRGPDIYPCNPTIQRTLKQAVKDLHALGVRCFPYINPRLWCERDDDYIEVDGDNCITVDEHGNTADAWGILGHTMCPTAKRPQEKMRTIVSRMIDEFGIDGAYLDQISSCFATPCFSANHGHGPGGHDHWCRGYRELLEKLQKDAKERDPNNAFTSESTIECYQDLLDLDLAREITNPRSKFDDPQAMPIPMFNAIYHDYHMTYGTVSTFISKTKVPDEFEWFRCAEALCLVGGTQLMISGAFGGDENKEELRPYFDYMEVLTRARKAARKFMNLGVWKPPLNLDCDKIDVTVKANDPPKKNVPAVLSGCYELDGELCIVLVNHTTEARDVTFKLEPQAYGLPDGTHDLKVIHPEEKTLASVLDEGTTQSMSIDRCAAMVLVVG